MDKQLKSIIEEYVLAGLSVVPVGKNKKATVKWEDYQEESISVDDVDKVFHGHYGVAVISGKVSGGLECIDFDAHDKKIDKIFDQFVSDDGVTDILKRNRCYIERSPRGGFHIFYRYESDHYDGNQCMARWDDGETMIETRGEGGYTVVSPTVGYVTTYGELTNIPTITIDERDYLIGYARRFNMVQPSVEPQEKSAPSFHKTDPVSWYNWNKADEAKELLMDVGWKKLRYDKREGLEYWQRPGKDEPDGGHSATWGRNHNALYIFTQSGKIAPLQAETYYTAFQLLVLLKFKGSFRMAFEWVVSKCFDEEVPYIRVGVDYYKRIVKTDRYGFEGWELKRWVKDEIRQDHGKAYLEKIPLFDDFTIEPDNFSYTPIIGKCYNIFREFVHKPVEGRWEWTEVLLRHIFGEQYELGLRYMQILYLHPKRLMPILVLVSRERQTGKTTFINWLNMIFRDNVANITPDDLVSGFNASYASHNIIAVEETLIEKSITVEKIKMLATSKFSTVNQKFVNQYRMPFYGKVILTSNNEDKFARIDQEEIRFFIRKVNRPTDYNHDIESYLSAEIPAFLHYLTTLPPVDFSTDRSGFTPDELQNDMLATVKEESHSGLYKDLKMRIEELFLNDLSRVEVFYADQLAIKSKFYERDARTEAPYIRTVLKNEFGLKPVGKVMRYRPFEEGMTTKVGRPFEFRRDEFVADSDVPDSEYDNTVPF